MARPQKNNADYFSHDANMRNGLKIKALRNKFGVMGYAIWCMLLECLTDSDGNDIPDDEIQIELMAGDFGVSYEDLTSMIDYCIRLELLSRINGKIRSKSLDERLAPLYEKRERQKSFRRRKPQNGDIIDVENEESEEFSTEKIPQSKVKESKVKNREINLSLTNTREALFGEIIQVDLMQCFEALRNDTIWYEPFCINHRITPQQFDVALRRFFMELQNRGEAAKNLKDAKHHFSSWYNLNKNKLDENNRKPSKENKLRNLASEFEAVNRGEKPFTSGATLPDL